MVFSDKNLRHQPQRPTASTQPSTLGACLPSSLVARAMMRGRSLGQCTDPSTPEYGSPALLVSSSSTNGCLRQPSLVSRLAFVQAILWCYCIGSKQLLTVHSLEQTSVRSTISKRHCFTRTRLTMRLALFLTTWHMFFATAMTQIMAKFTSTLDSRHKVPMTTQTYM